MAIGKAPFSFVFEDLEQAGRMDDLQTRLLFLIERLRNFKQHTAFRKENSPFASIYKGIEIKYESEINYVKELIASQPQQSKRTFVKQISFNCFKLEKTDLKLLWEVLDVLHNKTLVSKEFKLPKFKPAFSGGIVKDKIEWLGSIASLHFFIDEICKRIKNETKKQRWEITVKCFFIDGIKLTIEKLKNNKEAGRKDKEKILTAVGKFPYIPKPQNTTIQ